MLEIGKNLPGLQCLDISDCRKVTDVGVETVANGCPDLRTIYLSRCKNITNKSLAGLSKCQLLETLVLQGCVNIDDSGLLSLAEVNIFVLLFANILIRHSYAARIWNLHKPVTIPVKVGWDKFFCKVDSFIHTSNNNEGAVNCTTLIKPRFIYYLHLQLDDYFAIYVLLQLLVPDINKF